MTNVPPEGNVKMKVLKSKIKKTASLSEKSKSSRKFLQSTHVDKNEKVNCYKKKVHNNSILTLGDFCLQEC